MTNSTGYTEAQKALAISDTLGFSIDPSNMILAHSSMRVQLAPLQGCMCSSGLPFNSCRHQGERMLLVARSASSSRAIAEAYGWTAVDTVQELAARQPQLYPSSASCKVGSECSHRANSEQPYAAVVLLEMPANWGEAIQVLVDVLRGNGCIGLDCEQTIPFHCGNPDFDYKDVHCLPRMTLGAFRNALDAVYTTATGRALLYTLHGKPHRATYDLALDILKRQTRSDAVPACIVCVGDNPVSDIQGANGMGGVFKSALVSTGVWQGEEASSPSQVPWRVYGDVLECVTNVLSDAELSSATSSISKSSE